MRKWLFVVGVLGMTSQGICENQGKPIKLENQGDDSTDQIYFPPATEPYKPVEMAPASPPVSKEIPSTYVYETRITPGYQPQSQNMGTSAPMPQSQQISGSAAFSNVPVSTYAPGMPIGREAIEQAARTCESQLTQLWEKKSISDPERRKKFQKSMGEAKYRCDQLQVSAKAFAQADAHLNTFYFNLQQAQEAAN